MADITYIPIRQLHPHPDNPRKELGDLSELAASIKENGVYQNLTVIPGHYLNSREYIQKCVDEGGDASAAAAAWTPKALWSSEDYTIIIGHRRASAAQQAGLYELPCAIVEMDEREQMQTMMIENMQRSDLTVYEQAQGFQMMMDFGQTVEQIADKSGFSQSTIRRRVKLLELNQDNFKKAEGRGATLSDFAQLDKIENLEARNRVLETLGTQNFNRAMQAALEEQKWQHQKAEWVEQLKKFATEDPDATYQTHEHVAAYGKWGINKEVTVPEDAGQVPYFFKVGENQIDVYKTRDVEAENAAQLKRQAAREEEELIEQSFRNITELMFNLRKEFVAELTSKECQNHLADIVRYSTHIEHWRGMDFDIFGEVLGLELSEASIEESGMEWQEILENDEAFITMPAKVLLAVAFCTADDDNTGYWKETWDSKQQRYVYEHDENAELNETYKVLEALGYEMSDEERALQDGSHRFFTLYSFKNGDGTPCDCCKAAHPGCDKCCKSCSDRCNAVQMCQREDAENA